MKTYVYIIECRIDESSSNNPVKIGYTSNLKKRLAELQVGNPLELILLAATAYDSEEIAAEKEAHYHKLFKRHKIRGEWFDGVVTKGAAIAHFFQVCSMQMKTGAVPSITKMFLAKTTMTESKRRKLRRKHARKGKK